MSFQFSTPLAAGHAPDAIEKTALAKSPKAAAALGRPALPTTATTDAGTICCRDCHCFSTARDRPATGVQEPSKANNGPNRSSRCGRAGRNAKAISGIKKHRGHHSLHSARRRVARTITITRRAVAICETRDNSNHSRRAEPIGLTVTTLLHPQHGMLGGAYPWSSSSTRAKG